MRIGQMYFHTSIFISQRDIQGPTTLNQNYPITYNCVFKDQEFVSKNWQKSSKKNKNRGAAPCTPSLQGCAPSTHPGGW